MIEIVKTNHRDRCMGAAYNPRDCETCEKVQITGKDGKKK